MIAEKIEDLIKNQVKRTMQDKASITGDNYIATDSLGEVVEKLAILHIRTWMLEDAIQAAKTDKDIAILKKKIDICFKIKRPKYVAAINAMVQYAINNERESLSEGSVKLYKGLDNE